jgi:hypothetical protein
MTTMDSPFQPERRHTRYPIQLPVALKLAHKKMHARSENISPGGILLSSAFLIPEGSMVEVALGAAGLAAADAQMSARGKVVRVQPKATGDFAVAIAFERPVELGREGLEWGASVPGKRLKSDNANVPRTSVSRTSGPGMKNRVVARPGAYLALAWHTET